MTSSTRKNVKSGGRNHGNKGKGKCIALEKNKSFSNHGKAISLNSNRSRAKADDDSGMPSRAIGGDGHFFMCMKCENGGQLLCCDTCSCTYHLHCLNPPLESTPEGFWQCSNCPDNDRSPVSNKRRSRNKASSSSSQCSLCSKIDKILVHHEDEAALAYSGSIAQLNMVGRGGAGPSAPDAGNGGTVIHQTPKRNKQDKLLILRDALEQRCVQERDHPGQNNYATGSSRQIQKPNGEVHSTQRGKTIIRNTNRGSNSGQEKDTNVKRRPRKKASSDSPMIRCGDESVRSDALANNGTGAAVEHSSLSGQATTIPNFPSQSDASLMTVNGQNLTISSSSLPKSDALAASGNNMDIVPSENPSGFLRHSAEKVTWSGLELDALWVGVRRYGQEDWTTVLADPSLRVLKNKTPHDLAVRWKEEIQKIISLQNPSSALISNERPTLQLLPPSVPYLSLKSGYLGSYNHGSASASSSRATSLPNAPDADADAAPPHWAPNLNIEPMVSELLYQTLHQRANPEPKMRVVGMQQVFQTPGAAMASRTDQLKLLLGGHFPVQNASGGPSNAESNPQRETDED